MAAGFAFFGLGSGLVCATSPEARKRIAHTFHADFMVLSFLSCMFCSAMNENFP
jgi:choline-glycine betaine transporter